MVFLFVRLQHMLYCIHCVDGISISYTLQCFHHYMYYNYVCHIIHRGYPNMGPQSII
jgi:hypothetical protein